ncbi:hypothetical protein CCACVL1_02299 [Corchorus capsularis]|uniref:Uncharacterized protein n=1 Tax=Corchorus capsularis TaxID=210143 RepID=A0A1R3K9C8_COCAP|nr:hypothetical protein CCACVL1_02299 [Corchorus capsularis]
MVDSSEKEEPTVAGSGLREMWQWRLG